MYRLPLKSMGTICIINGDYDQVSAYYNASITRYFNKHRTDV